MCSDALIRRFAGSFVLISLLLGYTITPYAYLFAVFVGINLIQSSLTGFCLLERVLGRLHMFGCQPRHATTSPPT